MGLFLLFGGIFFAFALRNELRGFNYILNLNMFFSACLVLSFGCATRSFADPPAITQADQNLSPPVFETPNGNTSQTFQTSLLLKKGKKAYARGRFIEAVKWYGKAAEQGDVKAQDKLGDMYTVGEGVERDEEEAEKWYRKAAEQGDAAAQCSLGERYAMGGADIERDDVEAVKWYKKAAEQGYPFGCRLLGAMYECGHGVPMDEKEAEKWYRKAAELEKKEKNTDKK